MKTTPFFTRSSEMSPEVYAGFLKLWLAPYYKPTPVSPEVDAYVRHANQREPLPKHIRRMIVGPSDQAA